MEISNLNNFWRRVDKTPGLGPGGECWQWVGAKTQRGYGLIRNVNANRRMILTHRFSYYLHQGAPIPEGLFVCHHCDNPPCVRPDHLFLGTHQDNMADMIRKGRGNGIAGHRFSDDDVRAMRRARLLGARYREIAAIYKAHPDTVREIVARRKRANVI